MIGVCVHAHDVCVCAHMMCVSVCVCMCVCECMSALCFHGGVKVCFLGCIKATVFSVI